MLQLSVSLGQEAYLHICAVIRIITEYTITNRQPELRLFENNGMPNNMLDIKKIM